MRTLLYIIQRTPLHKNDQKIVKNELARNFVQLSFLSDFQTKFLSMYFKHEKTLCPKTLARFCLTSTSFVRKSSLDSVQDLPIDGR